MQVSFRCRARQWVIYYFGTYKLCTLNFLMGFRTCSASRWFAWLVQHGIIGRESCLCNGHGPIIYCGNIFTFDDSCYLLMTKFTQYINMESALKVASIVCTILAHTNCPHIMSLTGYDNILHIPVIIIRGLQTLASWHLRWHFFFESEN